MGITLTTLPDTSVVHRFSETQRNRFRLRDVRKKLHGRKAHLDRGCQRDIGLSLCADGAKKSAISDLFECASGGKCGAYEHGRTYWTRNPEALTNGTFAHMLEVESDTDRRALMQSFLHTAFAEFEKMLGGIVP